MSERRERYAAAIYKSLWPNGKWSLAGRTYYLDLADAVMAVADAELDAQPVYTYDGPEIPHLQTEVERLRAELERTHADYLVADRQADEAAAELQHRLRLAQLELMKANVLRELAETDAAGVKATLRELRADNENKTVMYEASEERVDDLIIERDLYMTALGDIRNAVNSSTSLVSRTATIDIVLKGLGL